MRIEGNLENNLKMNKHILTAMCCGHSIHPPIVFERMEEDGFDWSTKSPSQCNDYIINNF